MLNIFLSTKIISLGFCFSSMSSSLSLWYSVEYVNECVWLLNENCTHPVVELHSQDVLFIQCIWAHFFFRFNNKHNMQCALLALFVVSFKSLIRIFVNIQRRLKIIYEMVFMQFHGWNSPIFTLNWIHRLILFRIEMSFLTLRLETKVYA